MFASKFLLEYLEISMIKNIWIDFLQLLFQNVFVK